MMAETTSVGEAITVEANGRTRRRLVIGGLAAGLGGLGLGLIRPSEAEATTFSDAVNAAAYHLNSGRVDIYASPDAVNVGTTSQVAGTAIAIGHSAASVGGGTPGGNADGGFAISDYSPGGFTDNANPLIYASRYTGVSTSQALANIMGRVTARGAGNVGGGGWSVVNASYADQSGVQERNINSISSGVIDCGAHSFIVGERVSVYGSDNSAYNTVDTITAVGSTTITVTNRGNAGAAGKVRNAPSAFAFSTTINCNLDRSIITPGSTNSDDVGGVSVFSFGTGRGTDAYYITSNTNRSGSAWITGFSCGGDVDFAFNCGAITIGADNSLGGANPARPYGAAFDCSQVTLVNGADAMRLPSGGAIVSRVAAGGGTYNHLLSLKGSNNYVRLANDANSIAVWGGSADPAPTLANGRVMHLFGTASNPAEVKIDASTNSSRSQVTVRALDSTGAGARGEFYVDGVVPWVVLKTGTNHPLSLQVNNNECLRLITSLDVLVAEGCDFQLGTTTGTMIGTASGQKLGFFGKTPVIQRAAIPSPSANSSSLKTAVDRIRQALIDLGLTA
jgi:hypothetical protein